MKPRGRVVTPTERGDRKGQAVSYQDILCRLAIIDEGLVNDQAGLVLGPLDARVLDPKVAALVRVAALAAIGSPDACLEWGTSRALAVGASEDEITGVLLAVAPVIGLGRIVAAAPGVACGFGFDIDAALEDPGGSLPLSRRRRSSRRSADYPAIPPSV
jgi:alkylhydroperoxidase/carboxymuconolactone decarboxylase family protein YurZ